MKNNKGYSLIEILVTLGILSIISGIAYVSYQGYTVSVNKKDLKTHGRIFASAVQNCINASGGWEITLLQPNGLPNGAQKTPCKPGGTTKDAIKNDLKKKLNFTCPAGATCKVHTHTHPQNQPRLSYTCVSIEKEVSGKTLQVLSRVSYETPSNYEIWCNEVNTPLVLGNNRCRGGAPLQMSQPPQSGQNPPPSTDALIKDCPDW